MTTPALTIGHRLKRSIPYLCFAALLSLPLTGCNIVGPALVILKGPPTAEAQFEIPKDKSVVFFVDDRLNVLPRRALRQVIAEKAQNTLLANQKDRRVIDTRAAIAVAARETASEPMDIVTIGRTVKADLMIYVTIDSFTLSADGVNSLPQASYRIKVLDTAKDTEPRVWPPEAEGKPMQVAPSQRAGVVPSSTSERSQAEVALANLIGESIGKVFFKHETRENISGNK